MCDVHHFHGSRILIFRMQSINKLNEIETKLKLRFVFEPI